jgi:HD-GYP domain-containing protein (c-di-GMP phosphodiesterase class II)
VFLTEHILQQVPGFNELAAIAGAHHERLDGRGYPRGLPADRQTMPMRVLAMADVYEALISERPYRPAFTPEVAVGMIGADVPERLDADAFGALKALLSDSGAEISARPASVPRD